MPVRWCVGPEGGPLEGAARFDDLYEVARARLYVDSGLTHRAADVGTPVRALLRPTDAAVWAPVYSWRSAIAGSMREARMAGSIEASTASANTIKPAPAAEQPQINWDNRSSADVPVRPRTALCCRFCVMTPK